MIKVAAAALTMMLSSQSLFAQPGDTIDRFRPCSEYQDEQRLKCINALIGKLPEASEQPAGSNWIVSDTTSPVDYRPKISALTMSRRSGQEASSTLAIQCRGGRTDLLFSPAPPIKQGAMREMRVLYQIDGQPRVEQRWKPAESGKQLVFQGDVIGLLREMPEDGQLSFEVFAGDVLSGKANFSLAGLDAVRRRVAAMCRWP